MNITNELALKLFEKERKSPTFNEKKVFAKRLKLRINDIKTKYEDISLKSFNFLNDETPLYEKIMISLMSKKDVVLNRENLTVRFFNR